MSRKRKHPSLKARHPQAAALVDAALSEVRQNDSDDLINTARETNTEPISTVVRRTVEHEAEYSPRIRRESRLVPELKPLNWFDELEKHNPL